MTAYRPSQIATPSPKSGQNFTTIALQNGGLFIVPVGQKTAAKTLPTPPPFFEKGGGSADLNRLIWSFQPDFGYTGETTPQVPVSWPDTPQHPSDNRPGRAPSPTHSNHKRHRGRSKFAQGCQVIQPATQQSRMKAGETKETVAGRMAGRRAAPSSPADELKSQATGRTPATHYPRLTS